MALMLLPRLEDGEPTQFDSRHAEVLGRIFVELDTLAHEVDVRGPSSFDRYLDLELPEGFEGDLDALGALEADTPETWHAAEEGLEALERWSHVLGKLPADEQTPTREALAALRGLLEKARSRDVRFHLDAVAE